MPVARIVALLDDAQLKAQAAEADATMKGLGDSISEAGTTGGAGFGDAVDKMHGKVSGFVDKVGSQLDSLGLPFGSVFHKAASQIENADTKGQKFLQTMSNIGKVSLGVGAAGLAAAAAESVHLADQLDTAQSQLQTAVHNSGAAWDAYLPHLQSAYSEMANLGFENTDVAGSLQVLTTATNSPSKALSMLGLTANIARMQHESLTEAAQSLAKVLAGNARVVKQWGLNLNIGSGQLHSVQSASFALQTAQTNLAKVQAEMSSGQLVGAQAAGELASAQQAVSKASIEYHQSITAIPTILRAIEERSKGAAETFGKTLPGEIDKLRAQTHNLGTAFGEWLVPKIQLVAHALASTIQWFEHNRAVAYTLGAVIGVFLGTAILAFVGGKLAALGKGLMSTAGFFRNFGRSATEQRTPVQELSDTITTQRQQLQALQEQLQQIGPTMSELGQQSETLASQIDEAILQIKLGYQELGMSADEAQAVVDSAMVGMKDTTVVAANGMKAALVSTLIGGVLVAVGFGVSELSTHWQSAWHDMLVIVKGVAHDIVTALEEAFNFIIRLYDDTLGKLHFSILGHQIGFPSVSQIHTDGWASFKGLTWKSDEATGSGISSSLGKLGKLGDIKGAGTGKSGIASIGSGMPAGASSATGSSLQNSALSLLQTFQQAIQTGTVSSLRGVTTPADTERFHVLVQELVATHNAALVALADQLTAAHEHALQALNEVLEIQQKTALADQTQLIAQELTDSITLATDRTNNRAQVVSDKAQIVVDKLGERGLYGLNLVAQTMKVGLDRMTLGFDESIGRDQDRLDAVTRQQDRLINLAQKRVDIAANGSAIAQAQAQEALKAAQAHAAFVEAEAQRQLSMAQNNAKYAEAKEQALIAIEEAKAASQFAGSGLQVNITGINPTDAQAVASAVGWVGRTKIKVP